MGSIFINAGLAAGVALAAVPFILHLFMKQTPKHIIFPALRLIRERQKRSKKRLRVKNWLLLLARMLLVALMALALARPRIDAKATTGEGPAAAAFLFDTSLSMAYREKDKTRLDEAKERARELIKNMHEQSKIFIIDSSEPGQPIAQSPERALKRVDSLTIRPVNRPLNASMSGAYAAVEAVDLPRREVYTLTDLAASQWQLGQEMDAPAESIKLKKKVDAFVFRVGAKESRDVAILSAETLSPIATEDAPVAIKVKLRSLGPKATRLLELTLDDETVPREKRQVQIPANGELEIRDLTTSKKLDAGLHRIALRLAGEPDALEFDDHRYLTVEVRPAMKILVVSERAKDADFVAYALDPIARPEGEPRPFQVERVNTAKFEEKLRNAPLKGYSAVFLLNVPALDEASWTKLYRYVQTDGGGLVLAPADLADIANYNKGTAAQLMPAILGAPVAHAPDTAFTFGKPEIGHPLFSRDQKELLAELSSVPIYKTRNVELPQGGGSQVLLRYIDEKPALIERVMPGARAGKVLLWTTALSRDPVAKVGEAWNDFPIVGWGFLALMDQTAYYLSGAATQRLNFEAGEDVTLFLDVDRQFTSYSVQPPKGRESRREPFTSTNAGLTIAPEELGQWTVTAEAKEGGVKKYGFSVNPPRGELQLGSLDRRDLDVLYGKDVAGKPNYQLAESAADIKIAVAYATVGKEIFKYIMLLILLLVCLENLLANTFYREKTPVRALA